MAFFLPPFVLASARSRTTPGRGRIAVLVLAGSILGLAAVAVAVAGVPGAAHADSTFDAPESPLIEMQTDAEGDWFWQVSVTSGDTDYIATWGRAEGIWPNAEVAMAAATAATQCSSDTLRAYLDRFTTYAEFSAAPSTQLTTGADGTRATWTTDDATTVTVSAWAGVYLAYAGIALAVWAYFRYKRPHGATAPPD